MYYDDLAPCTYFGPQLAHRLVAVGWLDSEHPYPQSDVSEPFLDKLFDLLTRPWAPCYFLGYAECPFCGYEYDATYKGRAVPIGALNLFVPGQGFLYVMPSLAAHYILAHGYAPPPAFCEAVLRCPTMRSPEYFAAIMANAPQRYADAARKQLATGT